MSCCRLVLLCVLCQPLSQQTWLSRPSLQQPTESAVSALLGVWAESGMQLGVTYSQMQRCPVPTAAEGKEQGVIAYLHDMLQSKH